MKTAGLIVLVLVLGASSALLGTCGPFTDVAADAFCPFVLEIFTLGITTGTTPTTYDPAGLVTRLQMAAFLSRSVDGALLRGSRRALSRKFWTPQGPRLLGLTDLVTSSFPVDVAADGVNVWVTSTPADSIERIRASDGKPTETWTGATKAEGVVAVPAGVFIAGHMSPGRLYRIEPDRAAGAVTTVSSALGDLPSAVAFDGGRFWTTNNSSISIVTPGASLPWSAMTVTTGLFAPVGLVYDGSNMWVTEFFSQLIQKLDANGAILQTVTVGDDSRNPVFDGSNLWVPGFTGVWVIRASTGAVLATLTGNGLSAPLSASFDGQRVLVTDQDRVCLWKAADLTPLGFVSTGAGTQPTRVVSDGLDFWILLSNANQLARF